MITGSQVPDSGTPIFDAKGYIDPVWHQFFFSLLQRTGGTAGVDAAAETKRTDLLVKQSTDMQLLEASHVPFALAEEMTDDGYAWNHGVQYDPAHHAVATVNDNGFMSSLDKQKIDGIKTLVPATLLLAAVTNTNTTADADILAVTIPAGAFPVGSTLKISLVANLSNAAAGGVLSLWVKFGAGKAIQFTVATPAAATANVGAMMVVDITQVAANSAVLAGLVSNTGGVYTPAPFVTSNNTALDSTVANTITVGWNWSLADPANIAVARSCKIIQEA